MSGGSPDGFVCATQGAKLTTHPASPLQTKACAMLASEPVAAGQAITTASKHAFGP